MNLSSTARQIVFWLLIIAGAVLLYKLVNPRGNNYDIVDLTRIDQRNIVSLYLTTPRRTTCSRPRVKWLTAGHGSRRYKKNRAAAISGPC